MFGACDGSRIGRNNCSDHDFLRGRYVRKTLGTLVQVFVPTNVNAGSLFGTVEQVIKWEGWSSRWIAGFGV